MSRPLAILTGAASGIGRATALRLGTTHELALLDRDADGLAETLELLGEVPASIHTIDLLDGDMVDAKVAEIVEQRAPNLLVNIAGVGIARSVVDTAPQDWDFVIGVNLTAVYRMCRAALPAMIDGGGGVVVNVASVGGLIGVKQRAAYCASKAGVIGLTKAMAVDHAQDGIRAVSICPGTVETEWIGKILADAPDPLAARRAMEERQLDGRMGSPEEVAAGIAFLASPDGRFVNGSEFVMDGGMMAR